MSITLLGGFNSATYNPFAGPTPTIEYLIVAGGGAGGSDRRWRAGWCINGFWIERSSWNVLAQLLLVVVIR